MYITIYSNEKDWGWMHKVYMDSYRYWMDILIEKRNGFPVTPIERLKCERYVKNEVSSKAKEHIIEKYGVEVISFNDPGYINFDDIEPKPTRINWNFTQFRVVNVDKFIIAKMMRE